MSTYPTGDPEAATITAGRTERQQAIADLIGETLAAKGVDFGADDVVAVYGATIGYHVIDTLREHGLTITRRR